MVGEKKKRVRNGGKREIEIRGWERNGEGGERKGMKRRENTNQDERRVKKL